MADRLRETEIENTLKAVLGNGSLGVPIAWPNRSSPPDRPYIEVEFPDSVSEGGALKGQQDIQRIDGTLMLIVAVDNDTYTTSANTLAEQAADLYQEGTKLSITNGEITLMLPTVMKGFEANGHWRVPIRIPYMVSRV